MKYIFGLIIILIALQILLLKPFFGLMDDAMNLYAILPAIKSEGLFNYSWAYTQSDLTWGMFRPLYPFQVFFLYQVGAWLGPTVFYLINFLFVTGVLFFHSFVFSKILNLEKYFILVFTFAFPYTYDLFQHPSLQEKMVILWGSLLLFIIYRIKKTSALALFALTLVTMLGYFTKASFAIYFPMALLLLFSKFAKEKKCAPFYYFVLLNLGFIFFIKKVASSGSYTSRYSLESVGANLMTPVFLALILFFALSLLISIYYIRPQKISWLVFTPFLGLISFIFLFLPWGLPAYLLTLAGPLIAVIFVQTVTITGWKEAKYFVIAMATFFVFYRPYDMFSRLNDLHKIVNTSTQEKIYLPCMEGAASMDRYLKNIKGQQFEAAYLTDKLRDNIFILSDKKMCPLAPLQDFYNRCEQKIIINSKKQNGFKLISYNCTEVNG